MQIPKASSNPSIRLRAHDLTQIVKSRWGYLRTYFYTATLHLEIWELRKQLSAPQTFSILHKDRDKLAEIETSIQKQEKQEA
jgi:hypothetical protein